MSILGMCIFRVAQCLAATFLRVGKDYEDCVVTLTGRGGFGRVDLVQHTCVVITTQLLQLWAKQRVAE